MSVARNYAKALYESAVKQGERSGHRARIQDMVDTIASSKQLMVALYGPGTTSAEKSAIVGALSQKLSLPPLVNHFLALLVRKGRLSALPEISECLDLVRLEGEGGVLGVVESADRLEAADLKELSGAFSKKLGKKVEFSVNTEPKLLAGLRVTIGGVTYDGTLRAQLERLRESLVHGTGMVH